MIIYREHQEEAIAAVLAEMQKHKFVFLSAPTGAGKSLINLIVAFSPDAYITSPQVMLVDQYIHSLQNEFIELKYAAWIKGRDNYPCDYDRENGVVDATAAHAPCTIKDYVFGTDENGKPQLRCPLKDECLYYIEKTRAMRAPVAISTFHYNWYGIRTRIRTDAISDKLGLPRETLDWRRHKILIIDEAHSLPDFLVGFFTVDILPEKRLWKGTFFDKHNAVMDFNKFFREIDPVRFDGEKVLPVFRKYLQSYTNQIRNIIANRPSTLDHLPVEEKKEWRRVAAMLETLERMGANLARGGVDWIYEYKENNHDRKNSMLRWIPYEATAFVGELFNIYENVIFSSATFLDVPLFARRLGFLDYGVVAVPSTFPAENAPICFPTKFSINMKNRKDLIPEISRYIDRIAEMHPEEKGVVHCHGYNGYQIPIYNHLASGTRARVLIHTTENRREVLDAFLQSGDSSILLSVNMTEGADFKGDLARFQIIVKMPYADLGDPWVKEHYVREGGSWYNADALTKLIQACGRIMRSRDDWGVTYILDRNVLSVIERYRHMLPPWFRDRIAYSPCISMGDQEVDKHE